LKAQIGNRRRRRLGLQFQVGQGYEHHDRDRIPEQPEHDPSLRLVTRTISCVHPSHLFSYCAIDRSTQHVKYSCRVPAAIDDGKLAATVERDDSRPHTAESYLVFMGRSFHATHLLPAVTQPFCHGYTRGCERVEGLVESARNLQNRGFADWREREPTGFPNRCPESGARRAPPGPHTVGRTRATCRRNNRHRSPCCVRDTAV
jgi:hypothetical protein